jgi:hypothetical protein
LKIEFWISSDWPHEDRLLGILPNHHTHLRIGFTTDHRYLNCSGTHVSCPHTATSALLPLGNNAESRRETSKSRNWLPKHRWMNNPLCLDFASNSLLSMRLLHTPGTAHLIRLIFTAINISEPFGVLSLCDRKNIKVI